MIPCPVTTGPAKNPVPLPVGKVPECKALQTHLYQIPGKAALAPLILKVTLQLIKGGVQALGLPAAIKLMFFHHPAQYLLGSRKGYTSAFLSPWAMSDGTLELASSQ